MKISVLKLGGHIIDNKNNLEILANNIKQLKKNHYKVVIVHGGTPSINAKLKEKKIKSDLVNGFRKTSKQIMQIVEETILGTEVPKIIKRLNKKELSAISLSGIDSKLIKCRKKSEEYGFVGEILSINTNLLKVLLNNDIIPVISPIGVDDYGNSYNINSDYLASKIASALHADQLFMITNVNGIYFNVEDENSRIPRLNKSLVQDLIKNKNIKPTMETKVNACLEYISYKNNEAYIIDDTTKINYELFSSDNYGSKITNQIDDIYIRLALQEDIKEIVKLMHKSFTKYQEYIKYKIGPLKEKYEDLLNDIHNSYVFVMIKNNVIVGSARLKIKNSIGRISRIAISPEYQNNNLGSTLLKYIESYATDLGVNIIGLTTLNNVEYLEKFYEKNHYINFYESTTRGYSRALMLKNINNNIIDTSINFEFFN